MKKIYVILSFCLMLVSSFCFAQTTTRTEILGTFGNWTSYRIKEKDGNLCYMASVPQKSQGKYKKRGDIYLIVAHRPNNNSFDLVSMTAGYTYKKGSSVSVKVDSKPQINMFTDDGTAWAETTELDKKIVSQFKAGNTAVIKGTSSLGTLTTDTFSLSGFTKAYNAINKACGR